MSDFLRFVDELRKHFPVHVEIYYSKTMDWCITITKVGCAADYPTARHGGEDSDDVILVDVQSLDMELCFAKAHVALKEWLREFEGGY